MPLYKAMPLVLVRRWIRAKGDDVERELLAELNEAEQQTYASLVATAWVPVEFATKVYVIAAPLLYPNESRPVRLLGRDLAKDNFKGVFRFVLRVVSAETLMEKTSTLWRSFHDQGQATLKREGPQFVRFEVRGYPSLPEAMRESIAGWLGQAVELTGATDVRVMRANSHEDGWAWTIHWR